jgi:hypothetical protein
VGSSDNPSGPAQFDHALSLDAKHFDVIVATGFNVQISVEELQCLHPGEELQDEAMNFFLAGETNETVTNNTHADSVFSTLFYQQLTRRNTLNPLDAFRRGENRYWKCISRSMFSKTHIFIPIHTPGHWSLIVVMPLQRDIIYVDSLDRDGDAVLDNIEGLFVAAAKHFAIDNPSQWYKHTNGHYNQWECPRQPNDFDCGFYVVAAILKGLQRESLGTGQWPDMNSVRKRIGASILRTKSDWDVSPHDLSLEEFALATSSQPATRSTSASASPTVSVACISALYSSPIVERPPTPLSAIGNVAPTAPSSSSQFVKRFRHYGVVSDVRKRALTRQSRSTKTQHRKQTMTSSSTVKTAFATTCCRQQCLLKDVEGRTALEAESVSARKRFYELTPVARGQFVLDHVSEAAVGGNRSRQYRIGSLNCCRKAFQIFHGVGSSTVDKCVGMHRHGERSYVDARTPHLVAPSLTPDLAPKCTPRLGCGQNEVLVMTWMEQNFKLLSDRAPTDSMTHETVAYLSSGTKTELHIQMTKDFERDVSFAHFMQLHHDLTHYVVPVL